MHPLNSKGTLDIEERRPDHTCMYESVPLLFLPFSSFSQQAVPPRVTLTLSPCLGWDKTNFPRLVWSKKGR